MRFTRSIFGQLVEAIDRRALQAIVDRHDGDAYDKSFSSRDHLLALIFAQFCACDSLRGLVGLWNAGSQHHYHLGCGPLKRSTLSDANQRRPVGVFADVLELLVPLVDRKTRKGSGEMIRLIDSTPIPLGELCRWAQSNGRIRGMKMHMLYDPSGPVGLLDITDANVNDAPIGRQAPIEEGATYVFDKAYCHYGWWRQIAAKGAVFVTRPKRTMRLKALPKRPLDKTEGDGFSVVEDRNVRLVSKSCKTLDVPLRRVKVKREADGETIVLITNDLKRPAVEIAALYKGRWRIELLFRWLKQHLKIRKFLGNSANAIRLQLLAAIIAYVLLLIAKRKYRGDLDLLRLLEYVALFIFERRHIMTIERPPPVNPSRKRDKSSPNQLAFNYA